MQELKETSTGEVRDYQHKQKAYLMREQGLSKKEIAEKLGRSENWVGRWWRVIPETLPKPTGAGQKVLAVADPSTFRDVEIRRSFADDPTLFGTLARGLDWKQGKVLYRHEDTGELDLKFDRQGNAKSSQRWLANYTGGIAAFDKLLQKMFSEMDIRDTKARVVCNYYEDGMSGLYPHRHDYWTCLLSLGQERVLTIDDTAMLMRDGDLTLFGTQMHGVPVMPKIVGDRISIVIFFFPGHDNLEITSKWLSVAPDEHFPDGAASGCDCDLHATTLVKEALEFSKQVKPGARTTHELELHFNEAIEGKAVVYSIGAGHLTEKEFFERLAEFNVTMLFDLRTPHMQGICSEVFVKDNLKRLCTRRLLKFRGDPIGLAKGGIPDDVASEHGRFIIWKICAAATSGENVAFVGPGEKWADDDLRLVVGTAMANLGVKVIHCGKNGAEEHPKDMTLPRRLQPSRRDMTEQRAALEGDDAGSSDKLAVGIGHGRDLRSAKGARGKGSGKGQSSGRGYGGGGLV
eukprot:gnl/TRDRNA2_/TRDRNA2_30859_c0_seq1.p1 gnl/TRDRNA2_/TRDRNA2_30859_c0~~gnl/TRDRNA2_/TRDRNA2_30859_c0_seq1.p1  ORF type:complete len:581 (+),score=101.72 gnl/TRDRNA2_/TRDRNA2_30859_c0_seq1:193-1743(+)